MSTLQIIQTDIGQD